MARKNLKQRGLSRRRFMQSAAAMAASGTLLAGAAREKFSGVENVDAITGAVSKNKVVL